ncbi:hypothetical protein DVH26_17205 [Paenibacillus sp. H1-7]|nr:hypothetical protein DVH26_17205 [Paenibacillus sp. H1-7]
MSTTIKAYAQKNSLISAISEFAYTIAAKTDIAAVRSMTVGSNALFDWIVTYKELSGGKYNLYVQDSGAGIVVRVTTTSANIGDKISVSGSLADYFGLAQVEAADSGVQVVQMNAGAPAPLTIDSRGFAEANEGKLVKVQNITLGTSAGFSEYVVDDAFGSLMIKSDWVEPGKHYDQIVGVLTYSFNSFKLVTRSYSDIVESSFSVTPSVQPGIVAAGTAVYLSTPTTGAKVYYTIDGTTPTASSTEFQQSTPILINADTMVKAIVVNGSEVSPVQTFDYVIQKTYSGKKINEIQGAAHQSPWKGHLVTGVRGVVTHTESVNGTKRFYMQATESDQDQDASTSEAIVVISSTSVAVGDDVSVDGMVSEIKEDGYADAKDLTTTALMNATVTKVGTQTVPVPIVIGVDRIQPLSIIDNDGMQLFDPAEDALDFYESLESMRVQLNQPTVVGPYDYEIPVVVGEPSSDMTPNGGVILTGQDLNPERILIKKKLIVKTGDKFNGNVIGVLGYDFSNYKVLPTGTLPEITKSSIAQETSFIDFKENELTIAGFNIENFWNNPAQTAKKNNIAEAIVSKLKTPDIIGLIEVQDNNGDEETNSSSGNNGVTDANESYEALIQAIAAKGGPAYAFTDIAPENNKDGGSPGGNIRVGYLYNPARVSLVPKASGKGDATTAVSYGADGLSYNQGRIDPTNSAFVSSRKPLAAEFDFQGERVVVINNHFNSKGGDLAPYGAVQPLPATLGSEVQRHQIATVVNGFVKSVMQQNPNANVVMLGDLNDFQFSKTLEIVKGSELTNMVDSLPVNERYSYVYQGNSQTLDHILVNKRLTDYAKLDIVHMNADFDTAQGRVSDHDPLLLQVHLASKPEPTENIKLQLLSVNDLHGKINDKYSEKSLNEDLDGDGIISATTFVGGMDYMAGAMKQREAANPNTFVIHGGDMVGGSPPISALFQDEPTVEIMEAMGFDVGVPGNHEFDEGTREMLRLLNGRTHPKGTAGYDGQNFPLTVANVVYKSNGQHVLPPYIIKEVEGVKVGFVGVITEETPSIVIPAGIQDIEFTNAADAVNDAVTELKQQGVKSIIVLAHVPAVDAGDSATGDAAELAKAVDDEVDVIFAGHNHLRVNGEVDGKLIVQAWEYSKAFADVDLEINRTTGDIVSKKAEVVNNLQLKADPTVKGIIEKYNTLAAPFLNRVIGNSQVTMSKDYPGMGIGVNGDKALGNMIADGMKAEMNADFALMNGGGVRENLDAGEITWGELFSIQPFNNVLVKVEVTGADLEAILNAQLGSGSNYGPDFHVSGFKYTWYRDANNNRKVVDMLLPDGSKVDKAKTYTVVVNNYMQTSTNPKNIEISKRGKNPVTGPEDLEATVNFVRSFTTPLNYVEEGRIKEVAEPVVVEYRNDRGGSSGAVVTPPLPENPAGFTIDPADLKTETTEDGRVITKLAIKAESLVQALKEAAGSEAGKKLVISLLDVKDGAQVDFPANAIIEGVAASQDLIIEIKTNEHSYELPIRVIQAEALAAELGVGAADVTISVTIEKLAEAEAQKVKEAASKSGLTLLADAVSFKITAASNGKTIEVNNFGTTYVTNRDSP